jgi:hypothetical protein
MGGKTLADIFREVDEDLQQQRYHELWRRYGVYVIGGAMTIVLAVAGGQGWRTYQMSAQEEDGQRFARAISAAERGEIDAAAEAFASLATEASSGYGILARFRQAAVLAKGGDREGAVRVYEGIAADSSIDSTWRDLAVIYIANRTLDSADANDLRTRLERIASEGNPWRYSARELIGLLAERTGKKEEARAIFEALAQDKMAPANLRQRAERLAAVLSR